MGGIHRAPSPSGLTVSQPMSYVAVASEGDVSPVPGLCANSDAGESSPDLVRSMSESNALGESRDGPPAWYASSSSDLAAAAAATVPRVVSNVMPPLATDATAAAAAAAASAPGLFAASQSDPSLVWEGGFKHSTSAASIGSNSNGAAANSKPSATRRRQSAKAKTGEGGDPNVQRRQKRLERNRESARLSRRRRKQYLEVLETRVTEFSHEMDKGRREHVAKAIATIQEKRGQILNSGTEDVVNKVRMLHTALSRSSQELMVATTFRSQQLKSFALPPSTKFIMWLTLQSDAYFRGGRAASERLSAARIGERVRNAAPRQLSPLLL
jgi:bZIP transcription factor